MNENWKISEEYSEVVDTRQKAFIKSQSVTDDDGTIKNCSWYSFFLRDILWEMGYRARVIFLLSDNILSTECHAVTEVWIDSMKQWVIQDLSFNCAYFSGKKPLSVRELQCALRNGNRVIFLGQSYADRSRRMRYLKKHAEACMRYRNAVFGDLHRELVFWSRRRLNDSEQQAIIEMHNCPVLFCSGDESLFWQYND